MCSCYKKAPSESKLDGKTVIITGCNTGIGKETAKDLFERGARIIMACRDTEKAQNAADEIRKEASSRSDEIVVKKLDLGSTNSIRNFASEILKDEPKINILINNAGVMMCPYNTTEDGFEMQLGTNHLGHFLLTNLLLDKIKASAPARIINVSSCGHTIGKINFDDLQSEKSYNKLAAYGQSKLANILFTRELARRLQGTEVNAHSLHPGVVNTELGRYLPGIVMKPLSLFLISTVQGAQTSIYCAVSDELKDVSGLYYSGCKAVEPSARAKDDAVAQRLWKVSCELVNIEDSSE